ncbi:Gfo/Idh/MocA family protein [Frigoriglobus tundricola]|uniref:Inositol 2-dehydrogenase n=1 Tax=Frigoriglobus tundricola TaxID=2774151 RepID=A0A6M5YV71_9BACT|nr:Gfo/Idh/MocA family oxidoreductase [Frigoriglobus tundricola]QJW97364.1 Inositol 2-dehydrogenase [Frigoriglobus tundricola]
MSKNSVNRRAFIAGTAAAGAAMSLPAASYARIKSANEKLKIGFLGTGGRCQQHIDVIVDLRDEGKPVDPYAVCDVWDGDETLGKRGNDKKNRTGRGLYPSAKTCGIPLDAGKGRISKDYRNILDNRDVDVVCIATPDHWHAKMAIDAMERGKDVYMEKPMTKTIAEAIMVVDAAVKYGRTVTVGVQSMADPTWHAALDYIKAGNLGHVLQGTTSYYRNSSVGQWRYYPLKKDMTPKTIDWRMFLGCDFELGGNKLGPTPEEMPFDRAIWGQWRCYWPFGGGMFTDLFVHQTTHLIAAMGVRFPSRVVGAGGIYMEYDGRDVPDTATVVADYEEGCQVIISATMCNDVQLGEMIRGHLGTIKFLDGGDYIKGFQVFGQDIKGGPAKPASGFAEPIHTFKNPKSGNATRALWENFLEHVSMADKVARRETFSTPELGAAAFSTVNMGVQSYRFGKALFWDKEKRVPKEADASWASQWEARSKKHGKPNQIQGWTGGEKGSLLTPPDYQKLEGPWIGGKDPAGS